MYTRLISIGKSQGIRIPTPLIKQLGLTLGDQCSIVLGASENALVLRPASPPRVGWARAAAACAQERSDMGIWDTTINDGDGSWE